MDDLFAELDKAIADPWSFFASRELLDFQKVCHPDKWPNDREKATQLFTGFQSAYDRSLTPAEVVGKYRLMRERAVGDLRVCHDTDGGLLVKVPRVTNKAANNLAAKESEILTQLAEGSKEMEFQFYFPHMVETFVENKQRINVTFYDRRLVTAADIIRAFPDGVSGRHIAWMLKRLLDGLGYAHRTGWCHGAVTPEHVMYCPENHAGVLCGWIHAEKPGGTIKTVPKARKDWYPVDAKKGLTQSVDIEMAGRLMQELMNPAETPKRIQNFVKSMRLPASMRPNDAWELVEQFTELLAEVYGAPQFVELEI